MCAGVCPVPPFFPAVLQDTVQSAFKSTGVDVDSISKTTSVVTKTANEGVTAAKPLVSQAINFLTTTDPVSINTGCLHLVVAFAVVCCFCCCLLHSIKARGQAECCFPSRAPQGCQQIVLAGIDTATAAAQCTRSTCVWTWACIWQCKNQAAAAVCCPPPPAAGVAG